MTYEIRTAQHSHDALVVETPKGRHEYLAIWLRDNCQCSQCFNTDTYQRVMDSFAVPEDVGIVGIRVVPEEGIHVSWSDGHESHFTPEWLELNTVEYTAPEPFKESLYPQRLFWNKDDLSAPPSVPYAEVMTAGNSKTLFDNIWKYGFSYISDVPTTAEATEEMCKKILPIRHTHYGGFWDFTTDMTMKDTAYSDIEIPSHTDGTYWQETPFLQLFHLLFHDGTGGMTTLVDSFKCAYDLQREYPEDWEVLKTVPVECHSLGDVHLVQRKPVLIYKGDELVQVSWNISDRSTNYHLDNDTLKKLYKAMRRFNEIITREENVVLKQLKPGEVLIFDNWRVLHSRKGRTTGKRRMCGVYYDKDDFISTLRMVNSDTTELFKRSL